MKRRGIAALLLGVLWAGLAVPVAAKIPYFSIEFKPAAPVAGEPLTLVVRLWADAAHTDPEHWLHGDHRVIDHLIELQNGRARVPVTLVLHDDGSYRGTVRLEAGTWRLAAFPLGTGAAPGQLGHGYPTETAVVVAERPAAPSAAVAGMLGVAMIGAAAAVWRGHTRGWRLTR